MLPESFLSLVHCFIEHADIVRYTVVVATAVAAVLHVPSGHNPMIFWKLNYTFFKITRFFRSAYFLLLQNLQVKQEHKYLLHSIYE